MLTASDLAVHFTYLEEMSSSAVSSCDISASIETASASAQQYNFKTMVIGEYWEANNQSIPNGRFM